MILSSYNGNTSEQIIDIMQQVVAEASAHIEKLERAQAGGARTREKVTNCNVIGQTKSDPEYYKESSRYDYPTYETLAKRARKHLDELRAECDRIHEENKGAIANNIAIRDAVTALMKQIGFPDTHTTYEYKSSRSRNKHEVKQSAGWVQDMHRWLPCDDGYHSVQSDYDAKMKRINDWESKKRMEVETKKREEEKAQKAKDEQMQLAVLIAKYKLAHTSDVHDILIRILEQDRYLRLAHYLLMNRNDWNDGYSYARNGIDGFVPVTDKDKLMIESLGDLLNVLRERGEIDGRYFRDCEYNYTYIFGLVENKDLVADYNTVYEMVERTL